METTCSQCKGKLEKPKIKRVKNVCQKCQRLNQYRTERENRLKNLVV